MRLGNHELVQVGNYVSRGVKTVHIGLLVPVYDEAASIVALSAEGERKIGMHSAAQSGIEHVDYMLISVN